MWYPSKRYFFPNTGTEYDVLPTDESAICIIS